MQLHLEAAPPTSPPSLPSLCCPVLQLPVSLGKYSMHLVHRSLLWLKQFLVCCFGQCGLLSFVRESLCLEIAFPLEERQAKGSSSKNKKKRRGKRKTGRNNKEEPKVHREHTQPGEARHRTATRRISFQPLLLGHPFASASWQFCNAFVPHTHMYAEECVWVCVQCRLCVC